MKMQLATKPLTEVTSEALVVPVFENEPSDLKLPLVTDFLKENSKFGKLFQHQLLFVKDRSLMLLGSGKKEKFDFAALQNWAGTAVKHLAKSKKSISILLPKIENLTPEQIGEAVAIGAEIATHDMASVYKSDYEAPKLTSIEVIVERAERGYQDGLKKGLIIAEGINLTRLLGDMPANEMTPSFFLAQAQKIAKENKLRIVVLDEKKAKKLGMGAFTGVAQGSEEPSFMIAMEYLGNPRNKDKWGIVGKGITFDSGGMSIKPSSGMGEMKYDMSGAASALSSIMIASKLGLKTNIVAIMAVTENLPGGKAQRPGDIVKTYSGKTVEVVDTDAEGRLVLIDAVAYAQKDFKATKVIDLATLTGAIIVALGDYITGAMGNDEQFTQSLISSAKKVGEKMWELPMDEEFTEMIRSDYADIANLGHGGSHRSAAGSITAAKFIEEGIVKGTPWIHLDIAGTAWDMKPKPYRGPGATGVAIKTLVQLIQGE